jgi:DNA-binding CsgD family transcriptional regulator
VPAAVKAFEGAGDLATRVGDYLAAQALFEQGLAIARRLGDRSGIASALGRLSKLAGYRGGYAEADRLAGEGLAIVERHGDLAGLAATLCQLGTTRYFVGDYVRARVLLARGLTVARQAGDQRLIADAAYALGLTHHVTRDLDTAWRLYQESLAIDRLQGDRSNEGAVLNGLGHVAVLRGELLQARALLYEGLLASQASANRRRLAFTIAAVADLAAAVGEPERAIRLSATSVAALEELGARMAPGMHLLYDEPLAPARQALGEAGVAAATAIGRGMTLKQEVDEALAWLVGPGDLVEEEDEAMHDDAGPDRLIRREVETRGPTPAPRWGAEALTRREREVAALLGRGLTNRQIAAELVLTEGTANIYVKRVLRRLGLHSRAQVAAWAVQHGLHTPGVEP